MTLNEIAYNLLNLLRGGRSNHDEHISLDQLKFNIKHYRAMFVRRDFAKNGIITRHLEQDLGCLNLIKVDSAKCCGFETGCDVYRTELKLPRTIRFNFKDAITFVGTVDGLTTIPLINSNIIKYLVYDKYTANNSKAYMINDYMYLYNPGDMSYLNIKGVFENPEDLKDFQCETGICYDDSASDFPIPMDMLSTINQSLITGELRLLGFTQSDTTNDRLQGFGPPPPQQKQAAAEKKQK
jgi:ribosomal protein L21E